MSTKLELRSKNSRSRRIFISVGELSGDLLGGQLVEQLRIQSPNLEISGVVGPSLRRFGVLPLLQMEDLAVMGFTEVAAVLSSLRQKEFDLLAALERWRPDVAVLVDYPGFHLRLGEQLRIRGIPVIQYVAPKLWAWGAWRVDQLRRSADLVLGILPFEEDFYLSRDIPYRYVGCPLRERVEVSRRFPALDSGKEPKDEWTLGILPGSRKSEWKKILPPLLDAVRILRAKGEIFRVLLPVAVGLDPKVLLTETQFKQITELEVELVVGEPLAEISSCDLLLAASGTVTLEAALLGVPMVVAYRMSGLSFAIARRVVKIPYVSLVNLVAGKQVVPEILQIKDGERAAEEVLKIRNGDLGLRQKEEFLILREKLALGASAVAATQVLALGQG